MKHLGLGVSCCAALLAACASPGKEGSDSHSFTLTSPSTADSEATADSQGDTVPDSQDSETWSTETGTTFTIPWWITVFRDADADGWGVETDSMEISYYDPFPEGWALEAWQGWDCDDRDPEIHPLAGDEPGDGVDTDCTGSDACAPVTYDRLVFEGEDAGAEMEAFCADYGEAGYNLIVGDLGDAPLSGLACLCRVDGTLSVWGSPGLTSLEGLSGVTGVGDLAVWNNPDLASLEGLASLSTILNGLGVGDNPSLLDFEGIEAITRLGSLYVGSGYSYDLADSLALVGLESVTAIDGAVDVEIVNLMDLTGLDNLASVGGRLRLDSMDTLESLSGLENLESVGALKLFGLWSLTSLEGMDSLSSAGSVFVANTALTSVAHLSALTELPEDTYSSGLQWNPDLASLTGMEGISYIDGGFVINDHDILRDLDGLSGLRRVDGAFYIVGNASLVDVSGLEGVEYILGDLVITDNTSLPTEDIESLVDSIGREFIFGDVVVENNLE